MLLSLLLLGCPFVTEADWKQAADRDGDGFLAAAVEGGDDCNDADAAIFPGQPEICNGVDDDCDASTADPTSSFYADTDADGFGDVAGVIDACVAPEGYVTTAGECGDDDATVNPDAEERCDGADNNCDGTTDEGLASSTFFRDSDGDGFGDDAEVVEACDAPEGHVSTAGDCDDSAVEVFPGGEELCDGADNNCDGIADEGLALSTFFPDSDGDGYGDDALAVEACAAPAEHVTTAGDCDDSAEAIFPGGDELCDGVDNNCDGAVDELGQLTAYPDADGDGYGDPSAPQLVCELSSSFVSDSSDCDDTNAAVSPGAAELCDGVDQDCDGTVDNGATDLQTWYDDLDADGYGDGATGTIDCTPPPYTSGVAGDCDDADADRYPGNVETCDSIDQDCDGVADNDAIDALIGYTDDDADGYGLSAESFVGCELATGLAMEGGDCDDGDPNAHPAAEESCDGVDQDCDGLVDNDAIDVLTFYTDADADGFGDPAAASAGCDSAPGTSLNGDDCDDADSTVNPEGTEACGGADEDCDGAVDEADADLVLPLWYDDADGDGYGDGNTEIAACDAPPGGINLAGDCDDTENSVSPDATEVCDGLDNDCDSESDEGATDSVTWYADDDGDSYGDPDVTSTACSAPTGTVADSTDCNDSDAGTRPGAAESCDGADNDCDGVVDEGVSSTFYADTDLDTFGDPAAPVAGCGAATGYVTNNTDCDDNDENAWPGNPEVCDDADNDCDGVLNFGFSVPDDYSTIADAVNDAVTGDHICVAAGTWGDPLVITQGITLEGWEGSAVTIIDVDDAGTVLKLESAPAGTTVRGFTLRDGLYLVDSSSEAYGAGLWVDASDAILEDIVIDSAWCDGNTNCHGVAAWFENDASVVSGLTVTGTDAEAEKGAASTYGGVIGLSGSSATFDDVVLDGNTAELTKNSTSIQGGAIYLKNSPASFSGLTIQDTVIFERATGTTNSTSYAGLIYIEGVAAEFFNVRISDTVVDADIIQGGVLSVYSTGSSFENLAILASDIEREQPPNTPAEALYLFLGGLVYIDDGATLSVTQASIVNNGYDAVSGAAIQGGVFYLGAGATLDLTNSDVSGNTPGSRSASGPVVYTSGATANLRYNNLYDNDDTTDVTCDACTSADPGYTSTSGAAETWDLSPGASSVLINVGDPGILDADGSRSDIGAMGGPLGQNW